MKLRSVSRVVLGVALVLAGMNHFRAPELYVRMMPHYIPSPVFMVQASGAIEVVLGLTFCFTGQAWPWIVALLVAVFPANLNMALHPASFPDVPEWLLWLRLPLQALMILWAWWSGRQPEKALDNR